MKKALKKTKKSAVQYEKFKSRSNLAMDGEPVVVEFVKDRAHSPLAFENFIPWVCREWKASTSALVTPKLQENFRRKSITFHLQSKIDLLSEETEKSESVSFNNFMDGKNQVPVTAYYDDMKRLVEIAIVVSKIRPSRKLIAAFSLVVPYHPALTRFTYRRSCLTAALVYEINKLVLMSNISEVVFDDSFVPEANYYILLEQISQLRYLSLNRCRINDVVCKKLFENIQFNAPAANSLQILELSSNDITDDGAIFIGSVLRANRCLLHLNLSGNKITDKGFVPILHSLMEFPLNITENLDAKHRKIRYLKSRAAVYERCLNNLKSRDFEEVASGTSRVGFGRRSSLKRVRSKPKRSEQILGEEAEIMTRGILGDFQDPFSPDNLVVKNEATYCKGNFVLCYLNIGYNNVEYRSVQKLRDVVGYQDDMRVKSQCGKGMTGLIKITLDGNHIAASCSSLLDEITFFLKKNIFVRLGTGVRKITFKKLASGSADDFSKK